MKTTMPLLIASALALLGAPSISAATFEIGGDEALGCFMTVSGFIEPGDADRLEAFLSQPPEEAAELRNRFHEAAFSGLPVRPRICLDSEGGSLEEALAIADMLAPSGFASDRQWNVTNLGTAIPAGAKCWSACAWIFMSGGAASEYTGWRSPDRVLHALGSLGFHAPDLLLQNDTFSTAEVYEAYIVAIESIRAITSRQYALKVADSLISRVVATPPNDLFVLSTVGEATQWMIDIAGLPWPQELTAGHFVNACMNGLAALGNTATYSENPFPTYGGSDFLNSASQVPSHGTYRGEAVHQESLTNRPDEGEFSGHARIVFPFSQVDGFTCEVSIRGSWPTSSTSNLNHFGSNISIGNATHLSAGVASLFPPWARFSDLHSNFGTRAISSDSVVFSDEHEFRTRCLLVDASEGRSILNYCDIKNYVDITYESEILGHAEVSWADESTPNIFLSVSDGVIGLDGRSTRGPDWGRRQETGTSFVCYQVASSGDTFCLEREDMLASQDAHYLDVAQLEADEYLRRSCVPPRDGTALVALNQSTPVPLRERPTQQSERLTNIPPGSPVAVRGTASATGAAESGISCSAACRAAGQDRSQHNPDIATCYLNGNLWIPVDYEQHRGWVNSRYLRAVADVVADFDEVASSAQLGSLGRPMQNCFPTETRFRVGNVEEFVNVRRSPGFNAEVVATAALGSPVELLDALHVRGVGTEEQIEGCQVACAQQQTDNGGGAAASIVRQCLEDNVLWYRVRTTSGTDGFVSGRFLLDETGQ